jgi:hypothetical protein
MGDPPGWKELEEEPEMDRELQSLRRMTGGLEEASGRFLSASQSLSVSSLRRFWPCGKRLPTFVPKDFSCSRRSL